MKKEMISRGKTQGLALLLVFAMSLLMLSGCSSSGTNPNGNSASKTKCREAYNELSTKEFHSVKEARDAAKEFLSKFADKEQCSDCYDKAVQMNSEFIAMDDLLSNIDKGGADDDYCAFMSMVKSNNKTFANSKFETVKLTWNYLVGDLKASYMKERLDSIDEDDFKPYLMNYAIDLAKTWYRKFNVVNLGCEILNDEVDVNVVEGKNEKRGFCWVLVEMEGKGFKRGGNFEKWFPKVVDKRRRRGTFKIGVEGTLKVSETNCNLVFYKGNYDYDKSMLEGDPQKEDSRRNRGRR